jgi:histidinol-phosphate aminotransferase
MRDQGYKNANAEKVKISRTKLTHDLKNIGFAVLESHGNFVLATPPQGNAEEIYLKLKESGILVRYFNQAGLSDKLRITVGTDEQNQALIDLLSTL